MLSRTLITTTLILFGAASLGDEQPKKPANHLAKESSPYLLHHAHNPVDWYPWGEEALAKAQREGKLIFLSSGYHACHWCHVMERESFMNDEVAAILNRHFVCIKLDREERPEVDHIYLTALNAMGQTGGWPLSMFLTAEGKPIAGGTYWPREDREIAEDKVPGFISVLKSVIDFQQKFPDDIRKTADMRAEQTKRLLALGSPIGPAVELNRDLIAGVVAQLEEMFDPQHGGFGRPGSWRGPKFPRPAYLKLLQSEAARTKSKSLDAIVHTTLEHMARGGIYDQLGGSFHRYTVERTWTVPHFEKMLADNGQLLEVYARAYAETKRPLYRHVLEETLAFVDRELTSPDGAFYTSLDADTAGEEGRYYVWTADELAAAVKEPKELALLKSTYGVDGPANFEEQYYIFVLKNPVAEAEEPRLTAVKRSLLQVRGQRPRPALDTKVLTSWNGLMIAGMASAGHVLGDDAAVNRAVRAADFLLKTMQTPDGRLLHTFGAAPGEPARAKLNGYLDDYAYLAHGLLTLHDVTSDPRWLNEAKSLTDTMEKLFHDEDHGGFYFTSGDHEALFVRAKDQHDGAQPSGNSQTANNLVRLWRKMGDGRYRRLAERTFRAYAPVLKDEPSSLCAMAEALTAYLDALDITPLPQAHAHNDYEHPRPLFDALDHGFCSVEADIFLTPDGLLVAHDAKDLKPDRTLEKLYLDPLRERIQSRGGWAHAPGVPFYLLIDVKTQAADTYLALDKVLARYGDILSVTKNGKFERKAVTIVLSGNRAKETIAQQEVRYVGIDGRAEDLGSEAPADLLPWVSASWASLFQWQGDGPMPDAEQQKLVEMVRLAHESRRQVRFWATPEKEQVWKELLAAKVDLINTDKLDELRAFLLANSPKRPKP